jgi:hypothetical protein
MRYAREGYAFFCVETPSVFDERELPIRAEDCSESQLQEFQELDDLAVEHGTSVKSSPYQRG